MATAPLLDFAKLVAPVPGDKPAGPPLPFEIRSQLEEYRKEEDPEDFPQGDSRRDQAKKANWPGIVRLATETLTQTSKDLQVAARLTEALVKQHGFAGLRDGLHLLRLLVEQCWDRLNPPVEDGDVESRIGPFVWLDDLLRGPQFPHTLRTAPLIVGGGRAYSWTDWRLSQVGEGTVPADDVEKAFQAMTADHCHHTADDISQSLQELNELIHILGERVEKSGGGVGPAMSNLRQALDDCSLLAQALARRKPKAAPPGEAPPNGEAGNDRSAQAGQVGSRDEVYRQLAQAAARLKQLEPHSPIPYLVERAVELGSLPFPLLIKELIREPTVVAELTRELGIKEGAPAGAPAATPRTSAPPAGAPATGAAPDKW